MTTQATLDFMQAALQVVQQIQQTQLPSIEAAAAICTQSIANDGLVHMFGTGHSRIPLEEMFPRHGSFPGFHPIVELSMTFHNQVVGANGQRQAMLIEKMEGLGETILRNFIFRPHDSMMVFSNSGVNNVIMDVALGAKERGMPVVGVVSVAHCEATPAKHKSGKKLIDVCDVVIDNCTPVGDSLVTIPNLAYPVAPGSTLGYAVIVNAIKAAVAQQLTELGKPPLVLTSSAVIGNEASAEVFDRAYDDYRARVAKAYTG